MEMQQQAPNENAAQNEQATEEEEMGEFGPQSVDVLQVRPAVDEKLESHLVSDASVFRRYETSVTGFCFLFLQSMGIAASDIGKLKAAGIWTVDGLAHAPKRELEAIKGLSTAKVEKLLKEGPQPSPYSPSSSWLCATCS